MTNSNNAENIQENHKLQSSKTNTLYNWKIRHPYEDVEDRVCVEVNAWRGLLYRWRFVIPHDYKGLVKWGVGKSGTGKVEDSIKRKIQNGPVKMVNGPTVLWFGGNESISTDLSAYLIFQGKPPDYISFGQAKEVDGPPYEMEGITFGGDNHNHS